MKKTTEIRIKEVMKKAFTINAGSTVHEAVRPILEQKTDFIAVVNEEGRLVGVLGEQDMMKLIRERLPSNIADEVWFDYIDRSQKEAPVNDIMESNPITVNDSDSLDAALRLMNANRKRSLAVLDEDGKIAGVIGIKDIFERLLRVD